MDHSSWLFRQTDKAYFSFAKLNGSYICHTSHNHIKLCDSKINLLIYLYANHWAYLQNLRGHTCRDNKITICCHCSAFRFCYETLIRKLIFLSSRVFIVCVCVCVSLMFCDVSLFTYSLTNVLFLKLTGFVWKSVRVNDIFNILASGNVASNKCFCNFHISAFWIFLLIINVNKWI